MPEVLDWQRAEPRELVSHCVELLAHGKRVAVPTESGFDIVCLADTAHAFAQIPEAWTAQPPTILVRDLAEALAWAPDMGRLAERLARRSWPGPLTLVCDADLAHDPISGWDEAVKRQLCADGTLHLRAAAHDMLQEIVGQVPKPLIARVVRRCSAADAHALDDLDPHVDFVLDGKQSSGEQDPTIVRVRGNEWHVVQEGALPESELRQRSACILLFVCTGNTCRSPLAEGLCKKLLAEVVGCQPDELPGRGMRVLSAGLAAFSGAEASPEAVTVAKEHGVDLSRHASQPVTEELLRQADHIVTMTRSHACALEALLGADIAPPRLLMSDGTDITDPMGGGDGEYRACAAQIWQALTAYLPVLREQGDLPTGNGSEGP